MCSQTCPGFESDTLVTIYTILVICAAGAKAFSRAHFGRGSGSILLDDVSCGGRETRLVMCTHRPIGQHNCAHYEDAGVRCVFTELN